LGLYKFGIVGWSAGDDFVGGRGSLMTGWGKMEGEGEGWCRESVSRGRTSWGREAMDFSTGE
jgi:hypothetical protein